MAATEPLSRLMRIKPNHLTKEENYLLEAELLRCICNELKEVFRDQYKFYFRSMKFSKEMEDNMLEANFVSLVANDILATGEYTLEGFARYANTHEDVIHEIITGVNKDPSATLLRRFIDLHRIVRNDLYEQIIKKIMNHF